MANHCRVKLRCSICSGEHKYSECSAAAQNVPTAVAVTRRMRICPRYQREIEILKLKTVTNLSYADACASRIFLLGRYRNPLSTSISYSLSIKRHLRSLHLFSGRICTIHMTSVLKSIQMDQKPLLEPAAAYT